VVPVAAAGRRPVRAIVLGVLVLALGAAPVTSASGGDVSLFRYGAATAEDAARLGPGAGAVAYGVDDEGTLWLAVSLRGAAPDAVHEVYLVCGPTVAEACGYAPLFELMTDARGDAAGAEAPVALTALEAAPFGAGARLDHLTVVELTGFGAYVSDPLSYAVP
jgi:hypothetical protein